ncbi:maleylpyruvate isomerase family mycothiol-dependent enzyme [Yinghuangia aomiensis]|uniref:maleylpyruvate isomerase family mycothiol-dependent enzyme n=1 Tax=Yinghuangia aomiensis TaxID=676205 RepID=UPI0031F0FD97
MRRHEVVGAFTAEAERLSAGVRGLGDEAWSRPTVCVPWTVRELLGHVTVVVGWLPGMVAGEAPARATVSAVDYYRGDGRFSPESNERRIGLARERAARAAEGDGLAEEFGEVWRLVARLCAAEPEGRVVRTRHGDPMLLTDFLVTRVVEVAVHGLDLAAAVGREPWLSESAGDLLAHLLLGPEGLAAVDVLGWDRVTFLRKATGRVPLSGAETAEVERAGIRWLSLG